MKLNVGCGTDVREGWVNIDPDHLTRPGVQYGDAEDLSPWYGDAELVLLNHVLHLFPPDDARVVLRECYRTLATGGQLVVVEADVLTVVGSMFDGLTGTGSELDYVLSLVSDAVEPTEDGKLLRWVTWHGTRRSLWSPTSLAEALVRTGFGDWEAPENEEEWAGERWLESFVLVGVRT